MSHERKMLSRLAAIVAASIVATGVGPREVNAQSTFATLTGTVTDQSQAVLPGVTVTLTNPTNGQIRTATTSSSGEYQVPNLDAGAYVLMFRLSGFADTTRDVNLLARQVVRADVQLQ